MYELELQLTGSCEHDQGFQLHGEFLIKWNIKTNKDIVLQHYTQDHEVYSKYNEYPFSLWSLCGHNKSNVPIVGRKGYLVSRDGEVRKQSIVTRLCFYFDEVEIGEKSCFDYVHFVIPNWRIGFDMYQDTENGHELNMSLFSVEENGIKYEIRWESLLPITKLRELKNDSESTLTVCMTISKPSGLLDFHEAEKVADGVLDVCSIAYGDRVAWVCAIGYHSGSEVYRMIRNSRHCKPKPFRPLLRIEYPRVLTTFVSTVFLTYMSLDDKERHTLMRVADGISYSSERMSFPMPLVQLSSTIEDFCSSILEDRKTFFINKTDQDSIFPSFNRWFDENIHSLLSSEDITELEESLKQRYRALFQRNLQDRIKNLLDAFEINYDPRWVSDFVKKRNNATHGSYEFSSEDYYVWSRMAALIERVLLTKLNYSGEYIDWSVSPPTYKVLGEERIVGERQTKPT